MSRAEDAFASDLEREEREEEALLVVDRGVEVGARSEQRLQAAERLDGLAALAEPARALEQQLDVLGRGDVGDQLGDDTLEQDLVGGRLALEMEIHVLANALDQLVDGLVRDVTAVRAQRARVATSDLLVLGGKQRTRQR